MTDGEIDKGTLSELLNTVRSCINPYRTPEALSEISSTTTLKDSDALSEVQKLALIIKAHSTKLGIICHPDKFYQNLRVVYKELTDFNDKIFLLLSLLPLFHKDKDDKWAQFFIKALDSLVLNLLNGVSTMCDELDRLLSDEDNGKDDRLYAVGVIWASCDSLSELAHKGNFQVLADDIRSNCGLVDDVLQDIESWFEDPQLGDDLFIDDKDLDVDDGYTSEKEEIHEEKSKGNYEEALQQMTVFLKDWNTNLKMIKLLLSSFAKSLSTNVYKSPESKGSTLDKLSALQLKIVEQIDELVSDIFVSDTTFNVEDFKEDTDELNESLRKMVSIIKKLNKLDPKKSRWIQVWETKYFQDKS